MSPLERRPLPWTQYFFYLVCLLLASTTAAATEWPKEVQADEATIVIYQPQPESLQGKTLMVRAAMAIERPGKDSIFGAFWASMNIETDRGEDLATLRDIRVTRVTWPDSKDPAEQQFTQVVENAVGDAEMEISLSALTSSLAVVQKSQESLEALNTEPPEIVFREQLAVLLLFDGDPQFREIENSSYERALNTPLVVVKKSRREYYLTSGSLWYASDDPLGPWQPTSNPPADLVAMVPAGDEPAPATPPAIVTATEPTELVVTQGAPEWTSLEGGELLFVKNTETPWLRDLASGNMYLQLAGRWFRSKNQDGPWVFVRGDKLPAAFSNIPPASDIGGVRTSVAGTPEAEEAVADAYVPQTAAIKRDSASLEVEYDGKPKFEKIKGTDVAYAVNTGAQVLEIDGTYYAVDNGVWFTSASATGPWVVADTIPDDKIAEIPPTSPVYNTTYVTVYDSTPEVVYVGYTPGYLWSFPYYGVPVYGTGWYYPPYWGGFYYPRPPTWGFHVGYNPWTGWNFGVSWGGPFFRVGISFGGGWVGAPYRPWGCCGGWYGGGYRHNDITINTGDINIGNNVNIGNRGGDRVSIRDRDVSRDNLYNRAENRERNASPELARSELKKARGSGQRPNDLFADPDGQVARKVGDDWQVRKDNDWQQAVDREKLDQARESDRAQEMRDKANRENIDRSRERDRSYERPAQRPQIDRQRMNREFGARSRGNMRGRR